MNKKWLLLIILMSISKIYSNQVYCEDNITINAFETIRGVVFGKPILSCKLIKYEKLDTILTPNNLLSLLVDIEKYRYRCVFKIDTVIGKTFSDSIFEIIDEGNIRKHDDRLNVQSWFILNDKDTVEILSDVRCGKEQYSVIELIQLTQAILKKDIQTSISKEKPILKVIKEIMKTKNEKTK